ncbi:MAG: hydrolase [Desulfuromonas sp.]|nr:MAG: hydrolase [Desulfuromonas sp.]
MANYCTRLLFICVLFALSACSLQSPPRPISPAPTGTSADPIADLLDERAAGDEDGALGTLGFAIQVGAFTRQENAVRLEQVLQERGVDAYYFLHESGYYKVRFGDHGDYESARSEAERLRAQGVIERYFIVLPEDYAVSKIARAGTGDLRAELVSTAKRFIGVPYRWGGEDRVNGFDCSGLTMVSYRLNGLRLPRNSRAQFQAGRVVARQHLQPGDLVFFATKGGTRVTHVGMYVGAGQFIHAPRTGLTVRIADLDSGYFKRTYVGARTYL